LRAGENRRFRDGDLVVGHGRGKDTSVLLASFVRVEVNPPHPHDGAARAACARNHGTWSEPLAVHGLGELLLMMHLVLAPPSGHAELETPAATATATARVVLNLFDQDSGVMNTVQLDIHANVNLRHDDDDSRKQFFCNEFFEKRKKRKILKKFYTISLFIDQFDAMVLIVD
jgi:hypothetical protein